MQRTTFADVLDTVRRYVADNLPGCLAESLSITLVGGRRIEHPLPAVARASEAALPFVPSPFQRAILKALDGVALRTDALGAAVGDRSRLYRQGGLQELRERGLVGWHKYLGFYSVKSPPAALGG
jgi:hypothetical protein